MEVLKKVLNKKIVKKTSPNTGVQGAVAP